MPLAMVKVSAVPFTVALIVSFAEPMVTELASALVPVAVPPVSAWVTSKEWVPTAKELPARELTPKPAALDESKKFDDATVDESELTVFAPATTLP